MPHHFGIVIPIQVKDNISLQPALADVIKLLAENNQKELSEVVVSSDSHGKTISTFGDTVWDLWPYHIGDSEKSKLNFAFCERDQRLELETKVVCYTWLRVSASWKRAERVTVHTLFHRLNRLKHPLTFLMDNNHTSLESLSDPNVWRKFEHYMLQKKISQDHLSGIFSALKAITYIAESLPFDIGLKGLEPDNLSRILIKDYNVRTPQSIAIPQRLADLIYGKAIATVEEAWPHRHTLLEIRETIQKDYLKAKRRLDSEIDEGLINKFINNKNQTTKNDRKMDNKKYRTAIQSRRKPIDKLIGSLIKKTGLDIPGGSNKIEAHCNLILAACNICLVGLSGMRICESYQLRKDCYVCHIVNGQTFHILNGAHHKLSKGLKKDQWVCAPIAPKAVELAASITEHFRKDMLDAANKHEKNNDKGMADKLREESNRLWLSGLDRGKTPKITQRSSMALLFRRFSKFAGALVTEGDLKEFHLLNQNVHPSKIPTIDKYWNLSPNELRRTYVVFSSRHNLASLPALKQQLKHVSLQMTLYYCEGASEARQRDTRLDTELISMIDNCRIDFETDKLYEFYNSDIELVGGKGKVIVSQRESRPLIYSSRKTIRKLVKERKLSYHDTGVTGCTNGYQCEFDGIINGAYCVECDGAVIEIHHGKNWQKRHKKLVGYLQQNTPLSSGEYTHFITQIRAAEQVMLDLGLSFQSLKFERGTVI